MRARDLIVDFINFVFLLILTSFCIIFFIYKDNFKVFLEIIMSLAPISFFAILFLIKLKLNRKEFKKRDSESNLDIVLNLTFTDKITSDIILFLTPIIILLIPFLKGKPDLTDIIQATTVFLILYFWQKHLFKQGSL